MTQYQYVMTWYPDGSENILKCDEPRLMLDTLQEIVNAGVHVDVIDGFTGEVLCIMNHPDAFMKADFKLMMLGRQMEKLMG